MSNSDDQFSASEPSNVLPAIQPPPLPPASDFAGHVPAGQTMPTDSALIPLPESASDSDVIEKEWVEKAKQIVQHTTEDPFTQQMELSKIKADYMKKRYNKVIGTT